MSVRAQPRPSFEVAEGLLSSLLPASLLSDPFLVIATYGNATLSPPLTTSTPGDWNGILLLT